MTKQETFDIVARHLLTQRKRSTKNPDATGYCRYRGANGLKCAAGVLIPDDRYVEDMEGEPADYHIVARVLSELGHDLDLCMSLQMLHDNSDIVGWPSALRDVAAEHGLSPHVVTEMESFPGGVASR